MNRGHAEFGGSRPVERVMQPMSNTKSEQKEALKILADWTKWLVTLETGTIGATLAFAKGHVNLVDSIAIVFATSTVLGIASMCYSIFWAVYLVYGIPEIIEQLPAAKESSINEMRSDRLSCDLFHCQVRIYWSGAVGFLLCIVSVVYYAFRFS
jgi:hypothetical protein